MTRSIIYETTHSELFGIEMIFLDYKQYYEAINDALTDRVKSFEIDVHINRNAYEEKIKQKSKVLKEELLHLEDQIAQQYFTLQTTYPNYFRSFFLTQLYAFIETELKALCDIYAEQNLLVLFSKSPKNKEGELKKIESFLVNTCKVDEQLVRSDLIILDRARRIRNKIVHTNGIINNKEKEFNYFEIISQNSELLKLKKKGFGYYEIVMENEEMIEKLLTAGESLFKNLMTNEKGLKLK